MKIVSGYRNNCDRISIKQYVFLFSNSFQSCYNNPKIIDLSQHEG